MEKDKKIITAEEIKIPEITPILPIKGGVVFPNLIVPLVITDEKSKRLVDDILKGDRIITALSQKNDKKEPDIEDLFTVGTASLILKMMKTLDGTVRVMIQGMERVRVVEVIEKEPYIRCKIEKVPEISKTGVEVEAISHNILKNFHEIVKSTPYLTDELSQIAANIKDYSKLADFITSYMNFPVAEKQKILEEQDVEKRLRIVLELLTKEIEVIKVSEKIQSSVKDELDKGQREYILKEQLKAIQKELGILDDRQKEIKDIKEKEAKKKLPDYVKEVLDKEIDRLSKMMSGSPEATVVRNYIDWILSLPWLDETKDRLDVKRARKILNEDHYDLEKVKERILEFLAVRTLRKDTRGPIICFVGPPGVGKTSLGRSIARAMGRKFIRMSLGGIRDEAEIRGHRRTYIGALPGRIIQGIKNAGARNPVFMLDEIDKVGMDFRGDPTSALLEVLDPEQNFSFEDHYLDMPFDLSKVFFIATANRIDTIPPALFDRMEVIHLPGYIDIEKLKIAQQYLIARQQTENGLSEYNIAFYPSAILKIARDYTRESGVRNLERSIGAIMRKIAMEVSEGKISKEQKIKITPRKISRYLGPPIFYREIKERVIEPGIVTGLAWTPVGGEILFIEALKIPGGKNLIITGQIGNVMKESCQAALSLVKSKAKKLNIDRKIFEKYDIHIHVPEGATPKDGPSAGITIFVALVSLLTDRAISQDIAMTGEITLRGKILPVGGIKEKIIAAHRAGIKDIILPKWNISNLGDVPAYIKKDINFHPVNNVDNVIDIIFKKQKE